MRKRRFVSVSELTEATGLGKSTVHNYINQGLIPSTKVGTRILIPASYLERLVAEADTPRSSLVNCG